MIFVAHFFMPLWILLAFSIANSVISWREQRRHAEIDVIKHIPQALEKSFLDEVLANSPNRTVADAFLKFVHELNKTFDYRSVSDIFASIPVPVTLESSFVEGGAVGGTSVVSSNPHCDVDSGGPRTVQTVVPAPDYSKNPFNKLPSVSFDLTTMTTNMLNQATGPQAVEQGSAGLVKMVGMMMLKNMVQSAVATSTAIVPMGIPPPVWNLRPLPCMPMVTGGNCYGAVMYPITFADTTIADVTDSTLTGVRRQFRSMFRARAGPQPEAVYQRCFKAFMSLQCSSLFPMCTNPQGQDEMIPFIGRVPTCFTACLAVLMDCPGFTMADIKGPCTEISVPPVCTQAFYRRDDLGEDQIIESEIEGKLNSKCANYDPQVDAGQDPLLYEEEPPVPLFGNASEIQMMLE